MLLLADGLGDTIRVSLSEAPEAEIPVARKLTDYIVQRRNHPYIPGAVAPEFQYLSPERRATTAVRNIGGENLPVVVAVRLDGNMDFNPQFMPDYVYVGRQLPESPTEAYNTLSMPTFGKDKPTHGLHLKANSCRLSADAAHH